MRSLLFAAAASFLLIAPIRPVDAQIAEADRQRLFEQYREAALRGGDADRGRLVFEKQCANCHEIDGVGQPIGPSLTSAASRGLDQVLWNILDPSRILDSRYIEYHVTSKDGLVLSGMVIVETATAVTLVDLEGKRTTVERSEIETMQSTGKSIMPDRLDKVIDQQSMADLIAYLRQVGAVVTDSRITK